MGRSALECTLCGARSRWLALLIAFSPKPRSGGCSAAEGLGEKAILPFAEFCKKKKNKDSEGGEGGKFGLGHLAEPLPGGQGFTPVHRDN